VKGDVSLFSICELYQFRYGKKNHDFVPLSLIKFKYGTNGSHLLSLSSVKFKYGKTDHVSVSLLKPEIWTGWDQWLVNPFLLITFKYGKNRSFYLRREWNRVKINFTIPKYKKSLIPTGSCLWFSKVKQSCNSFFS
jgi:hypothetical protein